MQYIADLHIHSPFSRATSKAGDLPGLFAWAKVKGIHVVGTGDFTHPTWYSQLKKLLVPAEPGLFRLRDEKIAPAMTGVTPEDIPTRFLLSAEISSIYKRHGQVRKVHNLLYVPDFVSAEKINAKLAGIGNIESDGRPILGLDSRDLLEILLEEAPGGFLVPAHIWTPWFSLFGSRSGFNTIEECFGDLSDQVFALETGLSSDPEMNRLISALDRFALISNSDCHSPAKLGRESNIFAADFSFFGIRDALKNPLSGQFQATIEFFPEEGKYHCDGHRKCNICLEPRQTRDLNVLCPVCNRPLTVGVLHRVMELADRQAPMFAEGSPTVHSLIPLPEVVGEIIGSGPASKGVMEQYAKVIARFGSEFNVSLHAPIAELNGLSPVLGEAVRRIRQGKVIRQPGFDGEFGVIKVFEDGELATLSGQISLFTGKAPRKTKAAAKKERLPLPEKAPKTSQPIAEKSKNQEQEEAITCPARHVLVSAGPGTGKTFTLVRRLAALCGTKKIPADKYTVITFTNRAATEIRTRLAAEIGLVSQAIFVGTFHRFCLEWLRKDQPDLMVLGEEARALLLKHTFPRLSAEELQGFEKRITDFLFQLATTSSVRPGKVPADDIQQYLAAVQQAGMIDLEMIIPAFVARLKNESAFRTLLADAVHFLLVDEFQDVNCAQFELVKEMSALGAQIFAIGDPDQAIYGFRGSDLRFFARLGEAPDTATLALRTNYRSAPEILAAAAALIRHNSQGHERVSLVPARLQPGTINYFQAPTAEAEAEQIAGRLEEAMGGISHHSMRTGRGGREDAGRSFADFAVLSRLASQADVLAEAFARHGIPCQRVGAKPFFLNPSVRAAAFFLRLTDPAATLADFLALLKGIVGIGPATLGRLEAEMDLRHADFFSAALRLPLPPGSLEIVRGVAEVFRRFTDQVAARGLAPCLKNAMPLLDIDVANSDAVRLLELANAFGGNLSGFVEHLSQNARATVYDERAEAVALMTMHASKGLEFPVVFIAGLEEGISPCAYGDAEPDIEEERRLLYVAMTRAREALILSSAGSRAIFGRVRQQTPSRFLQEIPPALVTRDAAGSGKKKKPSAKQMQLF